MKRLLLTLAILLPAIFAQAQHHDLKFNAAGMLVKTPGLFYEYSPTPNDGIGVGINHSWLNVNIDGGNYAFRNTGVVAEYRRYFAPRRDADGFFAGGYLKGGSAEFRSDEFGHAASIDKMALGGTLGWKLVTEGGFVFETYGGLGKNIIIGASFNDTDLRQALRALSYLDFRLGVTVGYRIW